MPLFTIDFEASCLPIHGRSFPIEVGLADLDGWSKAWLIQPHPSWSGWTWTAEAEHLHGLTREQIDQHGLPAAQVMAEMAATVGTGTVIADSDLDDRWLGTLCAATRRPRPFRVRHIQELIDRLNPDQDRLRAAMRVADRAAPIRHRARLDALWLAVLARELGRAAAWPEYGARPMIEAERLELS